MRILIFFLSLLTFIPASFAADEDIEAILAEGGVHGGGGKSVVCRTNGKITEAWLLDLYEGAAFWGLNIVESRDPVDQQIERALLKLKESGLYPQYKHLVEVVKKAIHFMPPKWGGLKETEDSLQPIVPKCMPLEQTVNFTNQDHIVVSQEIWNHLSLTHRAALILHEAIYYADREAGLRDSRRARRIVAELFSDRNVFVKNPSEGVPQKPAVCSTLLNGSDPTQTVFYLYRDKANGRAVLQFTRLEGEVKLTPTTAYAYEANPFKWTQFTTQTEGAFEGKDKLTFSAVTTVNSGTAETHFYIAGSSGWLEGREFAKREFRCTDLEVEQPVPAGMRILDVAGASNFTLEPQPVIYAGNAGSVVYGNQLPNPNPDQTYNTCLLQENYGFSGLMGCNEKAVDGSTMLTITYVAAKPGYPVLLDPNFSDLSVRPIVSKAVSAGEVATARFRWSDICAKFGNGPTSRGVLDANCNYTSTSIGAFMTHVTFGVSSDPGGATQVDVGTDLAIVVNSNIGQWSTTGESVAPACEDAASGGVCHFEVRTSDHSVVVKSIKGGAGFPHGSALDFAKVRLLWAEGNGTFNRITAATGLDPQHHHDFPIVYSQDGMASLGGARIDDLPPGKDYSFKIAVIDLAGNIGYYTAPSADRYCAYTADPKSSTCHIVHLKK